MSRVPPEEMVELAARLAAKKVYVCFSHESHFLNPLVPGEWEVLRQAEVAHDGAVLEAMRRLETLEDLPMGIYFPAPISRGFAAGDSLESVLRRFYYDLIEVDEDQVWRWRGQLVAEKTRRFFLENLAWQPDLGVYCFEYKVRDGWFDKSYLETRCTPLVARRIRVETDAVTVWLNTSTTDRVDLQSFRLDGRERLFCWTSSSGEALFDETVRFQVLRNVTDDLSQLRLGQHLVPLCWPGASPEEAMS